MNNEVLIKHGHKSLYVANNNGLVTVRLLTYNPHSLNTTQSCAELDAESMIGILAPLAMCSMDSNALDWVCENCDVTPYGSSQCINSLSMDFRDEINQRMGLHS